MRRFLSAAFAGLVFATTAVQAAPLVLEEWAPGVSRSCFEAVRPALQPLWDEGSGPELTESQAQAVRERGFKVIGEALSECRIPERIIMMQKFQGIADAALYRRIEREEAERKEQRAREAEISEACKAAGVSTQFLSEAKRFGINGPDEMTVEAIRDGRVTMKKLVPAIERVLKVASAAAACTDKDYQNLYTMGRMLMLVVVVNGG